MASAKTSYHARSISLPSRSNPLTLGVEEQLQRLRSSEEASSASSSSSSLCHKLSGLRVLYDSIDDLFHLPHAQQVLSQLTSGECVNDVLDGSIRVLDLCNNARDVLLEMKESVQDLLSSLRRKRADLAVDVKEYMACKKKINKAIQKRLGDLKRMENKHVSCSLLENDQNLVVIISILKEVNEITVSIFKSLLTALSQPARTGYWSLVSKVMHNKRVASHGGEIAEIIDLAKLDAELSTLVSHKSCKDNGSVASNAHFAVKQLEALDASIHGLEEGLECVFRSSIKSRVSLLNILNH